jgi:hypothetical protein
MEHELTTMKVYVIPGEMQYFAAAHTRTKSYQYNSMQWVPFTLAESKQSLSFLVRKKPHPTAWFSRLTQTTNWIIFCPLELSVTHVKDMAQRC